MIYYYVLKERHGKMLEIRMPQSPYGFASNTYVLYSDGEYAVVDPSVPPERVSGIDGKVRYILLTHGHFDHMLDIDAWVERYDAEVIVSREDLPALSDPVANCYRVFFGENKGYFGDATGVSDGDSLQFGDTYITVMSCPGHTMGSVTYLIEDSAFVGDTVFAGGGYGRFDLYGGDFDALRGSIKAITELPPSTVLYPGHGEETTVSEFKRDFKYY